MTTATTGQDILYCIYIDEGHPLASYEIWDAHPSTEKSLQEVVAQAEDAKKATGCSMLIESITNTLEGGLLVKQDVDVLWKDGILCAS